MGGTGTVVEVSYAEGWDLVARSAQGAMDRAQAALRDTAGLPYVVVFRLAGRAEPIEVWLVSWQDHHLGVWAYDEQGRRIGECDLRALDDPARLLRRYSQSWEYRSSGMAEFSESCHRVVLELFPSGSGVQEVSAAGSGGSLITHPTVSEEQRWRRRREFGDWELFTTERQGLSGPLVFQDRDGPEEGDGPEGEPARQWLPPRSTPPAHLDALFRPGTRLSTSYHPMTVSAVREVATVRVPSGRLVVDCPSTGSGRELAVRIPPGGYALESAWVSYEYDFMGEHVETEDSAAVRLRVREEPVVSWEMALSAGEDTRILRDGRAYGFDTDVASGSFADAAAWPALRQPFSEEREGKGLLGVERLADGFLRTTDQPSAADLVFFPTDGDGGYVVWLGRGPSGEVAAMVVETGYLPHVEVL